MKLATTVLFATMTIASAAFAQAPTPAAPSTPAAPAATTPLAAKPPATTKDGKPTAKAARDECRVSVKSEGLKGDERQKAISDCFVKQRPDLAARETARLQCVADAKAKGIEKDKDARKAFMKTCIKSKV